MAEQEAADPAAVVHIHLDPLGGIAGDMFLAAMFDAWPELEPPTVAAMRAAGLPPDWHVARVDAADTGLTGSRMEITSPPGEKRHGARRFVAIADGIAAAALPQPVRARALAILRSLAEAEAKVHGIAPEDVHFHELAYYDSLADIVGAAAAIEAFPRAAWSVGPMPLGRGTVQTEHGALPVPAPATAELLRGYAVVDDGVGGERVTPTGAAIVRNLVPSASAGGSSARGTLCAVGTGFGTRTLPGRANALRLLAFSDAGARGDSDVVGVIRFEVDDQSPEDLALGLARVAACEGVRDVCQWPVYAKKGRLAVAVQVLCDPTIVRAVADTCLAETASIGLRWRTEQRVVLPRHSDCVEVDGRSVDVKRVRRPGGGYTAKAESASLADAGGDFAGRADLRRAAEGQAPQE